MFKNLSLSSSTFNSNNIPHKRYQSSNQKQINSSHNIFLSEKPFNAKYYCLLHRKNYSLFCSTCDLDICSICEKNHRNHNIYDSKSFKPTQKEINTLKKTIKKYLHDYNLLLNELNFWKKILDKKISYFTHNLQSINSNYNIKFVDEFNVNCSCFYDSVKFRKIYDFIIQMDSEDKEMSNNILNTYVKNDSNQYYSPFYNNKDYLLSETILNELISSNDDINNVNKFVSCSSLVINYITELNKKCLNFFNNEININSNNKKYQINTYSGRINSKFMNEDYYKKNNGNKIIEKYIDFKEYYSQGQKNQIKPMNLTSNTPKNNPIRSILKNRKTQNYSLKTSYSSNIIFKSPNINLTNSNTIYSKNNNTPKIIQILSKSIEFDNPRNKNGIVDLVLNSTQTIKGNRYFNKSYSVKNDTKLYKPIKNEDIPELNNSLVSKNNNIFNSHEKNLAKFPKNKYNLKQNNFIYEVEQKEKEAKTYIHKKLSKINFNNKKENNNSFNNYDINLNDKKNDNDFSNYEDKYNTLRNQKDIIKNGSNIIKSSLFKMLKYSSNVSKKKVEEKEMNSYSIKGYLPKIIKGKYEEKIIIEGEKPLYIGLDLGDSKCHISVFDQFNNEIKLISLKKNEYSIPTIIYFDENKKDVKIGMDAENEGSNKPTQIVFDLLKFIGIKYDEIIGKKNLWPFKIYQNVYTKKPYIKVNYDKQKGKIFYFEDILSIFIKKLFIDFFEKITLINGNNKSIKLYLQLSLPNYLNYFQKKVIEKIFENNIFSSNMSSNGYNIILKKIKLDNSTNNIYLYEGLQKINNSEKNILSVFIDGCSINLSIINKKRMLYEVKGIESAAFGEEDFTDNFICYCLRNLDERLNDKFLKSPSLLYQLRKSITLAKNNFNIIPQLKTEINIPKEESKNITDDHYDRNISILLKKTDYEKTCDEFFKKIVLLIKQILKNSGTSEIEIDDIVIIGENSSSAKIKSILFDIFKNNKKINKFSLLSDSTLIGKEIDKDCLISIGCILQLLNNYNLLKLNYIFADISTFSFGIENLDGLMDVVIPKGTKLPCKSKKLIKLGYKNDNICINILEGEHKCSENNKNIASAVIKKSEFKATRGMDYFEVIVELEIDCDYDLKCYIIDPKSKNKFECLIKINVVKN